MSILKEWLTEDTETGHAGSSLMAETREEAQEMLNIYKDMGKAPETLVIIGELVNRVDIGAFKGE
jgi:hypothetical protein